MKVYTYFEQAPELPSFLPLVRLWQKSWKDAGHEPIILTSDVCDSRLPALLRHVDSLPTINPRGYEVNNFVRWLAMDCVGGGLHVDSDVFPNKFNKLPEFDLGYITILQKDLCPCGFWVPAEGCASLVSKVFEYYKGIKIGGQEHCCDQEFIRWLTPNVSWVKVVDFIKSYLTESDWQSGKLIHYPTSNLPLGDKATIIKNLL